jgi:hypothetical protein
MYGALKPLEVSQSPEDVFIGKLVTLSYKDLFIILVVHFSTFVLQIFIKLKCTKVKLSFTYARCTCIKAKIYL